MVYTDVSTRKGIRMKVLEAIAGVVVGLVTFVILGVGSLFAFGSMGRYMKNKSI
jgi:hypothetical protein